MSLVLVKLKAYAHSVARSLFECSSLLGLKCLIVRCVYRHACHHGSFSSIALTDAFSTHFCTPMAYSGNSSEICGGPACLSVENSTKSVGPTPLAPSTTVGSSIYLGWANEFSSRASSGASFSNSIGMTNAACEAFCQSSDYQYWRTKYAKEFVPCPFSGYILLNMFLFL